MNLVGKLIISRAQNESAVHLFCNLRHQITEQLIRIALDPGVYTEVRIAAYLAGIRCADQQDIETVVATISSQENRQGIFL